MALKREPANTSDLATVEFLSGVTSVHAKDSTKTGSPWLLGGVIALVAAIYLGFVLAPIDEEPEIAQLHAVGVYFGNPFTVDWIELGTADETPDPVGLIPMAGTDPPCVGFGRPDWPAETRHPSVARCINSAGVAEIDADDAVGVWTIAAGADTWYFLYFAEDVVEIEAYGDGVRLEGEGVNRGGRFAAVLVETSSTDLDLTWKLQTGGLFGCHLDRTASGPPVCEVRIGNR